MEIIFIVLLLIVLGAVIFLITKFSKLQKPADDSWQRLMLDMVDNLRKEFQESGGKSRQEMVSQLDKITNQIMAHQNQSTQTLQQHFGQTTKIIT